MSLPTPYFQDESYMDESLVRRVQSVVAVYENCLPETDLTLTEAILLEIALTHTIIESGRWDRVFAVAKHAPDCEYDCSVQASYNCDEFDEAVAALQYGDLGE